MSSTNWTTVSNNDKAVNVGSALQIQHQDASVGSKAKNIVIKNTITNHHSNSYVFSQPPYPRPRAACFVITRLVMPDIDLSWNNTVQGFVTPDEAENESSMM